MPILQKMLSSIRFTAKNDPPYGWYSDGIAGHRNMSKKEAKNYGLRISKDWSKTLSRKERAALRTYKKHSLTWDGGQLIPISQAINNTERNSVITKWSPIADLISTAICKSTIDTNIVCYREVNLNFLRANNLDRDTIKYGDILVEKGFLSTFSHKPHFTRGSVSLLILVPCGAKGAYMDRFFNTNQWENEILFNKGYSLKVIDICKRPKRLYLKLEMLV